MILSHHGTVFHDISLDASGKNNISFHSVCCIKHGRGNKTIILAGNKSIIIITRILGAVVSMLYKRLESVCDSDSLILENTSIHVQI